MASIKNFKKELVYTYGALLDGTGKIWFSDLSFEVVDRSVATTNESGWDALPKPSNLDFSE